MWPSPRWLALFPGSCRSFSISGYTSHPPDSEPNPQGLRDKWKLSYSELRSQASTDPWRSHLASANLGFFLPCPMTTSLTVLLERTNKGSRDGEVRPTCAEHLLRAGVFAHLTLEYWEQATFPSPPAPTSVHGWLVSLPLRPG